MSLAVGQLLEDRYEIVAILQKGGMGAIYRAQDQRLAGSDCAVKEMLPPTSSHSADYIRQKFKDEMRVMVSVDHPGIPRVRDFFTKGDLRYIVMEFVEGQSLYDEAADRVLTPVEVAEDAVELLDILAYLHSRDMPILHRDIKPANIIRSKRLKLIDFGVAGEFTGSEAGTQVGTLGYCPIEQIQGRAEPRSDLYGLGATMHALLTRTPPTPLELSPLVGRPGLPTELAQIVEKATAREAHDRFADAVSMSLALQNFLEKTKTNPIGEDLPTELLDESSEAAPESEIVEFPREPSGNSWIPAFVVLVVGFALVVAILFAKKFDAELFGEASPSPSSTPGIVAIENIDIEGTAPVVTTPRGDLPEPAQATSVKPAPRTKPKPKPLPKPIYRPEPKPTRPKPTGRNKPPVADQSRGRAFLKFTPQKISTKMPVGFKMTRAPRGSSKSMVCEYKRAKPSTKLRISTVSGPSRNTNYGSERRAKWLSRGWKYKGTTSAQGPPVSVFMKGKRALTVVQAERKYGEGWQGIEFACQFAIGVEEGRAVLEFIQVLGQIPLIREFSPVS